jgi:DHA1 family multidrug resistance protein-like MFS transporter/DHA1 family quinolone resistance protein-like MFS transporter
VNPKPEPTQTAAASERSRDVLPYILFAAAFLIALAGSQAMLALVFYVKDAFQATPRQVGCLSGFFSLTYAVACLAIQFHLQRIRPGPLIAAATFCLGATLAGILLAAKLAIVFGLTAGIGVILSGFWPPLSGWLSHGLEGQALNRRIFGFNMSWSLGSILGPLLCGFLSERSTRLPLLVSAGLALLTTALLSARLWQARRESQRATAAPAAVEIAPATDQSTPYRYPAWFGMLAVYFCTSVIGDIFPFAAREELGFKESLIGLILFLRPLCNTLGFFILGRATFWHFRGWPMLAGQLLGLLVMLGLAGARSPLAIGILIAGMGFVGAASYNFGIFHGLSGSRQRGRRMAILESMANLGVVSGAMVGGTVCQTYGLERTYWMCAGIMLVSLLVQGLLVRRIRRR